MDDTANLDELGTAVRTAVGRVYRRFRSERPTGDLGDAAASVLTHLQKNGPQSLSALCERDRVTAGSMSQTVNRLTSAGYAVRGPDPDDGRRVLFSVTDAGAAVALELRARMQEWFSGWLVELSEEERDLLARASAVLFKLADAERAV